MKFKKHLEWIPKLAILGSDERYRLLQDTSVKTRDLCAVADRRIRATMRFNTSKSVTLTQTPKRGR